MELVKTNDIEKASFIEFVEYKYPEAGITVGKRYELLYSIIDPEIGLPEHYIIDDLGRPNIAAVMCIRSIIYKDEEGTY